MAAGKSREFAESILQYFAGDANALPSHTGLYVALLSAIPAGTQPYDGSAIAGKEILAGTYRAPLGTNKLSTIEKDTTNNAMSITNDGASPEIEFPTVAPEAFDVSGYAITLNATSVEASAYLAYETFTTAAKRKQVDVNDTIKINSEGLVIKEK